MDMKNRSVVYLMVILVASIFTLWGCPKSADTTAVPEAPTAPTAAPEPVEDTPVERAAPVRDKLEAVYFDFDQSFIRSDAKSAIKENAEWLKANPKADIRIEGNCDERGTIEYNQALGQRRAQAAKKYLTDLGISGGRISLISYGKEKPVCKQSNEDCWQENRRGDFAVVK
ncbi:MAG TPA: peptidoglycan-associated lipoprotein Pal [Nitrospiraceae bacterium]|nr:peptidoglycan-associated lipoprotein Pal [Nitrospiraceae bacterium]HAS53844.1 peptidoglycan-associated lipoprotein Pal [Nitrospiraceae bacterium]